MWPPETSSVRKGNVGGVGSVSNGVSACAVVRDSTHTVHMVHVHQRFAVHAGKGLGGSHADREATGHAGPPRYGNAIDIFEAYSCFVQRLTYYHGHVPVVCLRCMQWMNALGILVVLAQDDRR